MEWIEGESNGSQKVFIPEKEIREIASAVCPGREMELSYIASGNYDSPYVSWGTICLATVIDKPATSLTNWVRFLEELKKPRAPMWPDELYETPPDDALIEGDFSFPTRLLLAALSPSGVTFKRSKSELEDKYNFSFEEIETVITELIESGLGSWVVPTLYEAANDLTTIELEPLLSLIPIKKSWNKAKKIDLLFEALDADRIFEFIEVTKPYALEARLVIRYETKVSEWFHRAWSDMAGHFIYFCSARDQSWANFQRDSEIFGTEKAFGQVTEPVDECEQCAISAQTFNLHSKLTWPPFHMGCRCITLVSF